MKREEESVIRDVPETPTTDKTQPGVEIVESKTRYGRLLGGATNQYILLIFLRVMNETQQPVEVKSVAITLNDRPLNPLLNPGPSLPTLLTSKGQERLMTDKLYSAPFTIPSAAVNERYAFFLLPANFRHEAQSLTCTATVTFFTHEAKDIPFTVKW